MFYNNARRKVGLVGYWDTVAFDESVGSRCEIRHHPNMKDFMANGRFSRGAEVDRRRQPKLCRKYRLICAASSQLDGVRPVPTTAAELDLAVMDRFAAYIPGWEMPKNSSEFLTSRYGFITDYLAEAFHYQFKHTKRFEEVSKRIRLGKAIEGRDEKGHKKKPFALS